MSNITERPWGHYQILQVEDRFQVKKLCINPGQSISEQYHLHRAEHWVIVSGTAKLILNGIEKLVFENESVYIGIHDVHKLENVGKIPLVIIETQTGSYLGEDDIIRISDEYRKN